jgi:hypothetical protein
MLKGPSGGGGSPAAASNLRNKLKFRSLAEAENTLRLLHSMRKACLENGDAAGLEQCREAGRLIRRRAEMVSRNGKVRPAVRAIKAEIAGWFRIWLETPEIALEWLEMRLSAPDFQALARTERNEQSGKKGTGDQDCRHDAAGA